MSMTAMLAWTRAFAPAGTRIWVPGRKSTAAVAIVGVAAWASVASVDSTVGVWPEASGGRGRLLSCSAAAESSDSPMPRPELSAESARASAAVDPAAALG